LWQPNRQKKCVCNFVLYSTLSHLITNISWLFADFQVNLDSETRLLTLTNVQSNNPDQHVFDRAQRRIQHMMERDSYLRFLQSKLFLELAFPERYSSSSDVSD
jgi:uncharacterized protein YhdP